MTRCLPRRVRLHGGNQNDAPRPLWTVRSLGLQLALWADSFCGRTFSIRTVPMIRPSHFVLNTAAAYMMGRLPTPTLSLVDCWKLFAIRVCRIALSLWLWEIMVRA